MPLYLLYTMVQKSQKWPKTQIKGGGNVSKNEKLPSANVIILNETYAGKISWHGSQT